jgi:7-cyano-7-deazaguanine synthase
MNQKRNAIVLASGGLDSFVLAHYLKNKLKNIKLLFFDYGQRCLEEELYCVKLLAEKLKCKLKIIDLKWLGGISTSFINRGRGGKEEIIKWYVPCRNSIFILAALAHAESEFISKKIKQDIYIGIKYEGEMRFKDTTPKFLRDINKLARHAQKGSFEIKAPFLNKDKEDVIELAVELGVNLEDTYSCYLGAGFAKINNKKIPMHCGKCAGCLGRKKGFKFSNTSDPSIYMT